MAVSKLSSERSGEAGAEDGEPSPSRPAAPHASRAKVLTAFGLLYVLWGATYLGMKIADESMPPLVMAGMRFTLAGVILFAILLTRGARAPRALEWRTAAIVGGALMGGNATVAVAVTLVPSGIAALLVAMSPIWFVLFDWMAPGGRRPTRLVMIGLALGVVGAAVLIGPSSIVGGEHVSPFGATILIAGSVAWVAGSIYSRHAPRHESPFVMTAAQMLLGGIVVLAAAAALGEFPAFHLAAVTLRSWAAFAFLVIFGSLVGFTSYIYLLAVSTPAKVSTYAYVNPLVAVFLGWALAGEPVTARVLVAAGLILGAVGLMTTRGRR
jgi:drug/metabolite transporter (DMT)-like permease